MKGDLQSFVGVITTLKIGDSRIAGKLYYQGSEKIRNSHSNFNSHYFFENELTGNRYRITKNGNYDRIQISSDRMYLIMIPKTFTDSNNPINRKKQLNLNPASREAILPQTN